jgi:steroid delta-isomerase-like uncharacterized protein
MSEKLIQDYYQAFNNKDMKAMIACLSESVIHGINEGNNEKGKPYFEKFMKKMEEHYDETLKDINIMLSKDQKHAAAEFTVLGKYLKTDPGLPLAKGQKYEIKAGTFFEIDGDKISRVTTYYNLKDWVAKVTSGNP